MSAKGASRAAASSGPGRTTALQTRGAPTLQQHLSGPGPKRILAIDGGGIRGALALTYLERIEYQLRKRYNHPDLRLSDYYDLIGGTSTGAIIASALACGFEVGDLINLYDEFGKKVFGPKYIPVFTAKIPLIQAKYSGAILGRILRRNLGDIELGSDRIRTGLAIVLKRLDTNSPWVLTNNPRAKYFNAPPGDDQAFANRKLKLWKVVQASAAAPIYFPPVSIRVSRWQYGTFVDGGVSTYNNPALALLMVSTLKGFGLEWPIGPDKLLLTSVGTGKVGASETISWWESLMALIRPFLWRLKLPAYLGANALLGMINDGDELGRIMLQWISEPRASEHIDRLLGNLHGELLTAQPVLSYARYNIALDHRAIARDLGIKLKKREIKALGAMDNHRMVQPYLDIGRTSASRLIDPTDFPMHFDPLVPITQSQDASASAVSVGIPDPIFRAALSKAVPKVKENIWRIWLPVLTAAFDKFEIHTNKRIAAAMGQFLVEAGEGFSEIIENLNYKTPKRIHDVFPKEFPSADSAKPFVRNPEALANRAYAHKNGNGDEKSGDGFRFRGRGLIQLTGRNEYQQFGASIGKTAEEAALYCETPEGAAMSGCWYLYSRGCLAFADDWRLAKITRAVNGTKMLQHEKRAAYAEAILRCLGQ